MSTKSFLGRSDLPRGLRNNNPGNLVRTSIAWQGKIPHAQNTDTRFEQFRTLQMGIRAMIIDVAGDIVNKNLNTITKLTHAYAPPFENDTTVYIDRVSKATGIPKDAPIPHTKDAIVKIIKAKIDVENGTQHGALVTTTDISNAFDLISDSLKKKLP